MITTNPAIAIATIFELNTTIHTCNTAINLAAAAEHLTMDECEELLELAQDHICIDHLMEFHQEIERFA